MTALASPLPSSSRPTSPLRIVTDSPTPTDRYDAAKAALLNRGGWIPADVGGVRELLSMAVSSGAKFSRQVALIDLAFDIDRRTDNSARHYAARWGWSRYKAEELLREVGLLHTKSASDRPAFSHPPASGQPESGDNEPAERDSRPATGQPSASVQPAVSQPSLYTPRAHQNSDSSTTGTGGSETRAREDGISILAADDFNPRNGMPDLDAVKAWAVREGHDPGDALDALTLCIDRHWEYTSGGETYVSHDWRLALGKLCRHRKKNPKTGTNDGTHTQPDRSRGADPRNAVRAISHDGLTDYERARVVGAAPVNLSAADAAARRFDRYRRQSEPGSAGGGSDGGSTP